MVFLLFGVGGGLGESLLTSLSPPCYPRLKRPVFMQLNSIIVKRKEKEE